MMHFFSFLFLAWCAAFLEHSRGAFGSLARSEIESLVHLMKNLNETWFTDIARASAENACEWPEIGCECDGGSACEISYVSFYGMELTGTLPRDGLPNKLKGVKIFDLGNNRLKGPVLNAFVRSFPNLKSIKLGVNNLEGILPYELGNLQYLEEIDLDGGFTERQIYYDEGFPEEKKNKYGVPGSHFGNQFIGQIPESFRFLRRLKVLNIHRNFLSGPISYNALAYLQSLEYLDLSGNRDLSGAVPSAAIGRLQNIRELFLDDCAFSGPIPLGMASATKLEVIVLEGNKLSGGINPQAFPINITTLDLHDNFFTGPIPETLSKFKRLEVLLLHGNMFSGKVPRLRLPVLKTVSLAFNRNLCGPIPTFLPNAPKEAIEEECDKPKEPCKLYPARLETNLGKPCECAQRGQSCFSSASSIVLSLPAGASAEKCCEEGFSCEFTSGFGEKSCVPCMNANERCDGTIYGRPSCCKLGLVCAGDDGVCKGCQSTWSQCGGEYWTGAECCTTGNICEYVDRYYSQCRPSSSFVGTTTTTTTTGRGTSSVSQQPLSFNQQQLYRDTISSIACQPTWSQCGGRFWTGANRCCDANDFCFVQDEYYSQCRPKIPKCTSNYGQCGGRLLQQNADSSSLNNCCDPNYYCFTQDEYYSQCRPRYERNGVPCARRYEQCGGSVSPNGPPRCCESSMDYCFVQDAYYAQCRPKML